MAFVVIEMVGLRGRGLVDGMMEWGFVGLGV